MIITIPCTAPGCDHGTVTFATIDIRENAPKLVGRCDTCSTSFSLWGGEMARLDGGSVTGQIVV